MIQLNINSTTAKMLAEINRLQQQQQDLFLFNAAYQTIVSMDCGVLMDEPTIFDDIHQELLTQSPIYTFPN